MTEVSDAFYVRWRSKTHVGPYKPTHRVFVRHGEFKRGYHHWDGPLVRASIYGESKARPWSATWTPSTDWMEVPNVQSFTLDQDFTQDGTITGTLLLANVLYAEKTGLMGALYHEITRGALSPLHGFKTTGLPFKVPPKNEWSQMIVENAQIKVYAGYGDALEPMFVGFIDKVTPKASPDQLTVAMRDTGGKVLNDEHVFGWNKAKQLPEPVIFRQDTRKGKRIGYDAKASSHRDGHPGRFVTDTSTKSAWISADRSDPDNTEWIEVRLRRGSYSSFVIEAGYAGMEVYVGIYAKARKGTSHGGAEYVSPTYDGDDIEEGWVDLNDGAEVPGDVDGGWKYVRKYNSMSDKLRLHRLPGTFELGDDSILRIGFRRLKHIGDVYRASVVRLQAVKDPPPPVSRNGKPTKVVLVQDPSDMVRCALRWAGFKDWKVDDTGASLEGNVPFTRASTCMDIIKYVKDSTGFIFYMERPTNADDDLGTPVLRQNTVLKDRVATQRDIIRDTDLLTELETNFTDEPKSYIIRVRGRADKKGLRLGNDSVKQLMAIYRPPWSGTRAARIIRHHFTHDDPHIRTQRGCEVLARLIAHQMALQGATATAVVPGTPQFGMDDQAALSDTGTGTATRLWVVRVSHAYNSGTQAQFMTTLGGSLIDNPDVIGVKKELLRAAGDAEEIGKMGDVLSEIE